MTVWEAIEEAERLLPGVAAPSGKIDARWQAIIGLEIYIESDAGEVWQFILRWGRTEDEDLRNAIATCLLEHLLEERFDEYFPEVEAAVRASPLFADTFARCWKFGQAKEAGNAERFDCLQDECRGSLG